ncbi:MAG: carboxypeptidase-like regulatory domain-containing protein, partial [Gemmatimonadales bacterium]
TLTDVPAGRFTLGFFHPMLDSLGMAAPLHEVIVEGRAPVRADLAIPSASRYRAAICGGRPAARDLGAVLVGFVRDAERGAPAAGATVMGEWLEVTFRPNGVSSRVPRVMAKTGENGWFAICNVPKDGTMNLIASLGADSTDRIEVQVPAIGVARRELFLGSARTGASMDIAPGSSPSQAPGRVRRGEGRLSGTVFTTGGKPLPGAQVSISGGAETRTNDQGEWTIVDAPIGTRMLDVRALGFYPDRRRVDVIEGAPLVHVALSTLRAVLDTVRISATRNSNVRNLMEFQDRRRSGMGRYLTSADITKQNPVLTSELFRSMSGVRVDMDPETHERYLMVRGNVGDWCQAAIYLNGRQLHGVSADDMDVWVHPKEIAGIEVYAGLGAPIEYQFGMSGCGSVLIWTRAD